MVKQINRRLKFLTGLGAVVVILGVLGEYFWIFDLFSHFRSQYILFFIISACIFLLCRNIRWALMTALFSLAISARHIHYQFGTQVEPDTKIYKLVSYNLNSSNKEYEKVIEFISRESADIVFLMEVNSKWATKLKVLEEDFPYFLVHPRNDNFGLCLFSKYNILSKKLEYFDIVGVPSVIADINIEDKNVRFIGTHPVPPINRPATQSRNRQLSNISDYSKRSDSEYLIIAGDMNVSPWSHAFSAFVKDSKLTDASIGHGLKGTWLKNSMIFSIPIDHVLGSKNIIFPSKHIYENYGSDHNPLVYEFALVDQPVAGGDSAR